MVEGDGERTREERVVASSQPEISRELALKLTVKLPVGLAVKLPTRCMHKREQVRPDTQPLRATQCVSPCSASGLPDRHQRAAAYAL